MAPVSPQFMRTTDVSLRVYPLLSPFTRPRVSLVSGVATPSPAQTGGLWITGATTMSSSFSKNDSEHAFIGDSGWQDSSASRRRLSLSMSTFYLKDVDFTAGVGEIVSGNLDEATTLIQNCGESIEQEELFAQIYEFLGEVTGSPNTFAYKTYQATFVVANFRKDYNPNDGKITLQFDLNSRGEVFIGITNQASRLVPVDV